VTSRRAILRLLTLGATCAPVLKHTGAAAQLLPGDMSGIQPGGLRVEWRDEPLGIDTRRPRFTWTLTPTAEGARNQVQHACHVVVASSAAGASAGRGDVWDSGRRPSGAMSITPDYDLKLAAQTRLHWAVAVWDQHGRPSGWSEPAAFTTGICDPQDWRADWIAATADRPVPSGPPPTINTDPPVEPQAMPLFRHGFAVAKPIERAIVCVSGLGQYELRINGRRAGTGVLNPGWTDYRKTVLYNTFEVTPLLRPGANMLGVMLGNGMYNVERYAGRYTKLVGTFGQPKLILQLKLVFTDGSEQLIVSDSSWRTRPGPIVLSHTYGGEDFDARLEPADWDLPGDGSSDWLPAIRVEGPGGALRAQNVPPIAVAREMTPLAIKQPVGRPPARQAPADRSPLLQPPLDQPSVEQPPVGPPSVRRAPVGRPPRPGVYVYDLGENFSGWPKIVVRGPAGRKVKLLPGELLDDTGLVTQQSGNARPDNEVSFSYTLKGGADETWTPRFTYYGFRYVQVEGAAPATDAGAGLPAPGEVVLVSLQGEFLHADLPRTGRFDCTNPLLVRIHELITQALLSNTMSVLTDCPQREKLGWLEQTHLNADTVFYNEDAVTLYEKMLRDMQDSQLPDGMIPEIAPEYLAFLNADGSNSIFRDSPEWGAAIVLSPWATYRYTGDLRILAEGYPSMQRYAQYLATRLQDGLLDFGLGDWYDIGPKPPGEAQWTSRALTGTAIYCEILLALVRIADILGHSADARRYSSEASSATRTFNARLFDPNTNQYDRGSMTANAMPLAIGLVPADRRAAVLANLVADIRAHGNHVTAGDVGFHYVVLALMENGRGDVLYDILSRTDSPSYGNQLAQGATALTEAWDANSQKSQNHFMLGHAETWLYGGLGGIRIDFARPAESRIRIAPQVVAGVDSATVRYRSVLGEIASSWRRHGGRLQLDVEVPPGAMAQIEILTAGASEITESGVALERSRGILHISRTDSHQVILVVGSGSYHFEGPDVRLR
jgi:alpha-L-rhamnosidase